MELGMGTASVQPLFNLRSAWWRSQPRIRALVMSHMDCSQPFWC